MKKIGAFFKFILKWAAILIGIWIAAVLFSDLEAQTRIFLGFIAVAMAISYVDSTHKDRISNLEFRIGELERQIRGYSHDF